MIKIFGSYSNHLIIHYLIIIYAIFKEFEAFQVLFLDGNKRNYSSNLFTYFYSYLLLTFYFTI